MEDIKKRNKERRRKATKTWLERTHTGYHALANAIIGQAVKDYKSKSVTWREITRIQQFIRSTRFRWMCDLNPDYVIRKLDEYRREHGYPIIWPDGHWGVSDYNFNRVDVMDFVRSKKG